MSFANGLLTVQAENSSLGDILQAVARSTGAKIDTVAGVSSERVAAKIGPASPRDVLVVLLKGSRFDYIILGAMADPGQVERLILTQRRSAEAVAAGTTGQPSMPGSMPAGGMQRVGRNAGGGEDDDDEEPQGFAAPPQGAPYPNQIQPLNQQNQMPGIQPNEIQMPPTAINPNPPAKTPEQLLDELKQMQNQQEQPSGRRPPR